MKAWVLWWRYDDGSSSGIIRAYTDEVRANEDFAMVKDLPDKEYNLDEVEFFASTVS